MDLGAGSALASFLGATAFRLALSFGMDRFKDWQEHRFEMERIKVQDKIEQNIHDRNLQSLRVQKLLGVLEIAVHKEYDQSVEDSARFDQAVASVTKPTGVKWLDTLNSVIRPELAQVCILVWGISIIVRGFVLTPWDLELISATLGVFVGSRITHTGR